MKKIETLAEYRKRISAQYRKRNRKKYNEYMKEYYHANKLKNSIKK